MPLGVSGTEPVDGTCAAVAFGTSSQTLLGPRREMSISLPFADFSELHLGKRWSVALTARAEARASRDAT